MSIEKMKADLSKLNDKIGQLQRKAKDMEERILQAENMEYLKIIRKNGISAEELQLMIDISNEEQKQILATREKEQTGNEEDTWLTARNKWLLAHPESTEAKSGAHIGLTGKNIDISEGGTHHV